MIVGDDDPGRIDDEAGAERIGPALVRVSQLIVIAAALLLAMAEEFVEKIVERRAGLEFRRAARAFLFKGLRRRNIDHGVAHLGGEIGKVVRRVPGPRGFEPENRRQSEHRKHRQAERDGKSRRDPVPQKSPGPEGFEAEWCNPNHGKSPERRHSPDISNDIGDCA